jgi:hypothetical protein
MDALNPIGQNNVAPALSDTEFGVMEKINCELNYQDKIICLIDRTQEKSNMDFKNLTLFANTDKTYVCYLKDRLLNEINITGATCTLNVRENKGESPVITKSTDNPTDGVIGAPNKGEFYFYIVPSDTSSLEERQYFFDIVVEVSLKTYVVAEGVITLRFV